uniref:Myb/SANT-like DNA-binding domain-containing protein n=1 Tax=Glossina morsitans morsitans TaxID=37546 RepID=A0A1B0FBK5_GLOMM
MSTKPNTRNRKRRPGDPWVSKNRVLNGGAKLKNNIALGRNPNFDTDETKVLIQLWGDPKVQRQLITTHKKYSVIVELSAKMEEYGYFRTPEEITTRIKNLKCIYNRLKKEVESGECSQPSWRHYAEMDAVMSRPIFSVRPNEVPAPSIKFQIEQELERRKERKRKILEEGGSVSESDDEDIIDVLAFSEPLAKRIQKTNNNKTVHGINLIDEERETEIGATEVDKMKGSNVAKNSDNGNDKSVDDEFFIKMEIDTEEFIADKMNNDSSTSTKNANVKKTVIVQNNSDKLRIDQTSKTNELKETSSKHHNNSSNKNRDSVDDLLLVPKVEPIDVDAEDEIPKTCLKSTPTSLSCSISANSICSSASLIPITTITNATTSIAKNASTQQGKISLVPTNFLMQPSVSTVSSQPQIRLLPNASGHLQPHLVLSTPATPSSVNGGTNNTGIVTTGPGGMKLLLVNADQSNKTNTGAALSTLTTNNITASSSNQNNQPQLTLRKSLTAKPDESKLQQQISTTAQAQQTQQQQQQQSQQPQKEREEREDTCGKKDIYGVRLLISKLITAQKTNNDLQKQRLAVERERLDFEKSAVEKFFQLFGQHVQQQSQLQQQVNAQQQHITHTSQQVLSNSANLQNGHPPTQLRINPKVLFTTVVSSAAATLLTSNVLTTNARSNFNTIVTPIQQQQHSIQTSDVQLVAPKLEPNT